MDKYASVISISGLVLTFIGTIFNIVGARAQVTSLKLQQAAQLEYQRRKPHIGSIFLKWGFLILLFSLATDNLPHLLMQPDKRAWIIATFSAIFILAPLVGLITFQIGKGFGYRKYQNRDTNPY